MQEPEYEFTTEQNHSLRVLTDRMRYLSYIEMAIGAIYIFIFLSTFSQIAKLIEGLVLVTSGYLTNAASTFFVNIIETEGSDITNLMKGMEQLKKLFSLKLYLYLVGFILGVIAFVIIFFVLKKNIP
ncbi:MAG: hypothetical protein KDK54_18995 [Leptospiraceae bacterium]|nr:hypothetical protein [Leptospiraceae bacterium]